MFEALIVTLLTLGIVLLVQARLSPKPSQATKTQNTPDTVGRAL